MRTLPQSSRTAVYLASLLCLAGVFVFLTRQPLDHDAAWLLHAAEQVLQGKRLYVDLVEVNPPLIVWLGIPVIMLSNLLRQPYTTVYPVVVGIAALASVAAAHAAVRRSIPSTHGPSVLFFLVCALVVFPTWGWGQREHLMLILTTPFVAAAGVATERPLGWRSVLSGVSGGLGFALKPHFLPGLLALAAWQTVRRRVPPTTVVALVVVAGYGILVAAGTPYLEHVWSLRHAYGSFAAVNGGALLLDGRTLFPLAALLLVLVPGPGRELRIAFGLTCAAWIAAAVAQGKGFRYHFIPPFATAFIVLGSAFADQVHSGLRMLAAALGTLAFATVLCAALIAAPPSPQWERIREVERLVDGRPALMLTPMLPHAWPHFSYADAEWSAPAPSAWPLLGRPADVRLAASWIVPALQRGVDVLAPGDTVDTLHRLLADSAFAAAWTRYAEVERGEYFILYRPVHARRGTVPTHW